MKSHVPEFAMRKEWGLAEEVREKAVLFGFQLIKPSHVNFSGTNEEF